MSVFYILCSRDLFTGSGLKNWDIPVPTVHIRARFGSVFCLKLDPYLSGQRWTRFKSLFLLNLGIRCHFTCASRDPAGCHSDQSFSPPDGAEFWRQMWPNSAPTPDWLSPHCRCPIGGYYRRGCERNGRRPGSPAGHRVPTIWHSCRPGRHWLLWGQQQQLLKGLLARQSREGTIPQL